MILQGKITLAYLEEDNTQTGLFRMRPLLNPDGIQYENAQDQYPDDGYLRIVPDKNEQHTFKSRMRELKPLCVLDLRNKPQGKVRKNRNYCPEKQETNQYVVYSNALCACPDDMCYQVVPEGKLGEALTNRIYIRKGAVIRGPYLRSGEQAEKELRQLAPDCRELYTLSLPDSREILMYWAMSSQEQPEKKEQEKEISTSDPAGENSFDNALDQIQNLNRQLTLLSNPLKARPNAPEGKELPQPVGKGTPLYAAEVSVSKAQTVANPLAKVVDAKRRASRKTAPEEENQISDIKPDVQTEHTAETSPELNQLQDLEAERLRLLMHLEDVKKDEEAYKQQLFEQLQESKKEQLAALDSVILEKKQLIRSLADQQKSQLCQRSDVLKELIGVQNSQAGYCDEPNTIIDRVLDHIREAGFSFSRIDSAALLTAAALSIGSASFGIKAGAAGDALLAAEALCFALGAPLLRGAACTPDSGDGLNGYYYTPSSIQTGSSIRFVPLKGWSDDPAESAEYLCEPIIVFPLHADQRIPVPAFVREPSQSSDWLIRSFAKKPSLNIREEEWLHSTVSAFSAHGYPLPLSILRLMAQMIGSLREFMSSNPSDAFDYAFLCCALPYLKMIRAPKETILPLIAVLPRTLKEWNA